MVKDDVDKDNLVFQYTNNSKEVSVDLMFVLHINMCIEIVNINVRYFDKNVVPFVTRLFLH